MKRKKNKAKAWKPRLAGLGGLVCLALAGAGLLAPRPEPAPAPLPASHYPMEVGRFWIYHHTDPGSGDVRRIERRIAEHEQRQGHDLYYYGDGAVVYERQGKVFEMGPGGGVNVIPVLSFDGPRPYVYRSEGLHIEKSLGAVDTTVVVAGRRYQSCIEVVTRYRAAEGGPVGTYSSYYARGIGLVGRRPGTGEAGYTLALRQYGVEKL